MVGCYDTGFWGVYLARTEEVFVCCIFDCTFGFCLDEITSILACR